MKEFYANAFFDGDELRCWVRGKDFTRMPSYLAIILNINRQVFIKPLVYDELEPDLDILQDALGETWRYIQMGNQSVYHCYLLN